MFFLGQKQALDMCFGTLASFFIPLKTSCVLTALKKSATAGCGPYIPLPWPLLSFNQLTFPLNHNKQICLEKECFCWRFSRLISAGIVPLWLQRNVPFSCLCVLCVYDRERDREEFLSDSVIRSSQNTRIGVLSGQTHAHAFTNHAICWRGFFLFVPLKSMYNWTGLLSTVLEGVCWLFSDSSDCKFFSCSLEWNLLFHARTVLWLLVWKRNEIWS